MQLPPSTYLATRDPALPGPGGSTTTLDPATLPIEVHACGLGLCMPRRFLVLNPTAVPWDFEWDSLGTSGSQGGGAMRCNTPRGTVMPGARYEMEFAFTPTAERTHEAFFHFRIPAQVRS